MKELFPGVALDPAVQFGKPVIVGTRVPVDVVIGHIAAGDTIDEVMREYRLKKDEVYAALRYAAKIVSQETVMVR